MRCYFADFLAVALVVSVRKAHIQVTMDIIFIKGFVGIHSWFGLTATVKTPSTARDALAKKFWVAWLVYEVPSLRCDMTTERDETSQIIFYTFPRSNNK